MQKTGLPKDLGRNSTGIYSILFTVKKTCHIILFIFLGLVSTDTVLCDTTPAGKSPHLIAINFKVLPDNKEVVIFELDHFKQPQVFGIEGDFPRVVCDFYDTLPDKKLDNTINAGGVYIRRLRIGTHITPKAKTRVVLDLEPGLDYDIQQLFSEENRQFTIVAQPVRVSTTSIP